MIRLSLAALVAAVCFSLVGCGPGPDLSKALEVTDVLTGYYDDGIKNGKNHLLPSISFRLRNRSESKIGPVQMTVAFWSLANSKDGKEAEWDSVLVQAIHGEGLAPGASTDSILARSNVGYTLEGARADFFAHHLFQDVTAKLFAAQGGSITPVGEFKLDRVIIPHLR